MAIVRLCSINDRAHHLLKPAMTYTITVKPVAGYPELIHNDVKLFHPTKEIVFGHKHNNGDLRFSSYEKVSDEQYIAVYRTIIGTNMPQIKAWYKALGDDEQMTICCYCAPDTFCHRQFVYKTLIWLSGKMSLAHRIELF